MANKYDLWAVAELGELEELSTYGVRGIFQPQLNGLAGFLLFEFFNDLQRYGCTRTLLSYIGMQ